MDTQCCLEFTFWSFSEPGSYSGFASHSVVERLQFRVIVNIEWYPKHRVRLKDGDNLEVSQGDLKIELSTPKIVYSNKFSIL